jgi:phage gpG-like protein
MIEMTTSGTLPQFNPEAFKALFPQAAELMEASTHSIFDKGGIPTWAPLKKSGLASHLGGRSGSIESSVFKESGDDFAAVGVPSTGQNWIHQAGGTITNGFGRGILIHMPQRKYLAFTDSLKKDIMQLFIGGVPKFYEPVPIKQ